MTIELLASARAGLESTRGTPVTPTRILYFTPGQGQHNQDVGTITPRESWASYTPLRRAYAGLERNTLRFSFDATYTLMHWWLNLTTDAEASGSVQDTSAYDWTFLPVHTSDALKSATFEFAYLDLLATFGARIPGCIVNIMRITWLKAVGGDETGVRVEVELMSPALCTDITAFTGALSDVSQRSALGNSTRSYVNGTGSAFGTTADTRVNMATWEVNNNYVYRDGFDGTSAAIEIVRTGPRQSRFTMQRYFSDKTELDAYRAKTIRRVRMLSEGAVVGATTAKEKIQLDIAGVPLVHDVATVDGLIYANIELEGIDDSSISSDHKFVVTNTSSTTT